jgi:hypothetical protein
MVVRRVLITLRKRHQGASPGEVQPDRGTKRIGITEGLLTLAAFQGGQPETGQNCGLPFDLGDSRSPAGWVLAQVGKSLVSCHQPRAPSFWTCGQKISSDIPCQPYPTTVLRRDRRRATGRRSAGASLHRPSTAYSLAADAVLRNEVGVVDRFSREFQGGLDIVGA